MYGKNGVIYSEGIGVCRIILSAMSKKGSRIYTWFYIFTKHSVSAVISIKSNPVVAA